MSGSADDWASRFYPKGLRFFTTQKSVRLVNGQLFNACMDCGTIWNKIEPFELRKLLEHSGTKETKAALLMNTKVLPASTK